MSCSDDCKGYTLFGMALAEGFPAMYTRRGQVFANEPIEKPMYFELLQQAYNLEKGDLPGMRYNLKDSYMDSSSTPLKSYVPKTVYVAQPMPVRQQPAERNEESPIKIMITPISENYHVSNIDNAREKLELQISQQLAKLGGMNGQLSLLQSQ